MPLAITCSCGQQVRLDGRAPGTRLPCNSCGRPLTVPGGPGRPGPVRVWTNPSLPWGENVVVLTADRLCAGRVEQDKVAEAQAGLLRGQAVAAALGAEATELELAALLQVRTHQHDEVIDVHYRDEAGEAAQHSFAFAGTTARDEALAALGQRLGWRLETRPLGVLRAALWPALTLALVALFTFGFTVAAREMGAGAKLEPQGAGARRGLAWVLLGVVDLLGVWGVLVVGGLAAAGAGAWLCARVRRPPVLVTLGPHQA